MSLANFAWHFRSAWVTISKSYARKQKSIMIHGQRLITGVCRKHATADNGTMAPLWGLLKHDRTGATKNWPFWHRGRQTGRQKYDGTNILKAKLWKPTLTRTTDSNRPTRCEIISKLALTRTPDTIWPMRWAINNN